MTDTSTAGVLDRLLDPAALSALVGADAAATSARVQPGSEIVVATAPSADALPTGWLRALWPSHSERRSRRRLLARRRTREPEKQTLLDGDVLVRWGDLGEDPQLGQVLRSLGRHSTLTRSMTSSLIHYEPLLRADILTGSSIVRHTAQPEPLAGLVQASLAGVGLPVLSPTSDVSTTAATWPATSGTTLLDDLTVEGTRWAGATLARLHLSSWVAIGDDRLYSLLAQNRFSEGPVDIVDTLSGLDAGLGERLAGVVARLVSRGPLSGPEVLLHGNVGPDRLLVQPDGKRLLTGFDHAGLGPGAVDLGHWLVVQPDLPGLADDFLSGYELGGGRVPDPFALINGRAWGMVTRVLDPVRDAAVAWRDEVAARIDEASETVG